MAEESVPHSLDPLPVEGLLTPAAAGEEEGAGAAALDGCFVGAGAFEGALDDWVAGEGALDDWFAEEGALDAPEDADGVEAGWLCEPTPGFVSAFPFAGADASGVKALLLDETEGEPEDWLGLEDAGEPDHEDEAGALS